MTAPSGSVPEPTEPRSSWPICASCGAFTSFQLQGPCFQSDDGAHGFRPTPPVPAPTEPKENTVSLFRKKPVVIEATVWQRNGDHPDDKVGAMVEDPMGGPSYERLEGQVVRFFRHPDDEYRGAKTHDRCGRTWHDHGWIDTLEGGHTVCPGDFVITGVQGERYPCKPDIFKATYEPVTDRG